MFEIQNPLLKKIPLHVAHLGSHAQIKKDKKAQKMRKISEETPLTKP
jgi:hypothetical protein